MTRKDRKTRAIHIGVVAGLGAGAVFGLLTREPLLGGGVGISLALVFGMLLRVMRVMGSDTNGNGHNDEG